MCFDYVLHWACGHPHRWEHKSCQLGNRPLPGGCPIGKPVEQYLDCDPRRGDCSDCVKKRVEAEGSRRRQAAEGAVYYRRQAVVVSCESRSSLICEDFERLRLETRRSKRHGRGGG